MKKILITRANSYIGTSFEKWALKYADEYLVESIDMKDNLWRKKDFSVYDVVFHVAGIAHVSSNLKLESIYYSVNRDLAIETAEKAKIDGVKQFIFMSSIIVYGNSIKKFIDNKTIPKPNNHYGKSKLLAENGISLMQDESFNVVIIRSPMIYGSGCKGNYSKLSKLAQSIPIFPDIDNERSMLYIDNLCEFVRLMIENDERGIFFPQNAEYVKTSELVKMGLSKKMWLQKRTNYRKMV